MNHTLKKLEKSEIELEITVSPTEYAPEMKKAADKLSLKVAVKGFRKGKVPYEVMKREAGEMAILQEALEPIVQKTFFEVIKTEKIETIGMPHIDVDKVAPGNDLVYRATVAVLPKVVLPNLSKIKVDQKEAKADDKQTEETIEAIRGMHATEVIKEGPADGTDKLVIDMDMLIDNVPVEGGQSKDYQVYLSENHYIPGFNEQVVGLSAGEEKTFSLTFPETHYQKHLAGKKVDFKVKAKEIFERRLPEANDELAKKMEQESMGKLRELVANNILEEAKRRATQQTEIEILEKVIAETEFEAIPEVLIDSERQKMFHELTNDLERNGITVEQYLQDIKKDEKELYEGFKAQAEKRAKAALASRQVALEQKIEVSKDELDKELELLAQAYAHDKNAQENLKRPEVKESIAVTLQNKKVMDYLKEQILPKGKPEVDKKTDNESK